MDHDTIGATVMFVLAGWGLAVMIYRQFFSNETEHTIETGCGLYREDFDSDRELCVDGGAPWEHPERGKNG